METNNTEKSQDSLPSDLFSQLEEAREAVKIFVERKLNYLQNQMPSGYSVELQLTISTDAERKEHNCTYMRIGLPRMRNGGGISLAPAPVVDYEEGEKITPFRLGFDKLRGMARRDITRKDG